MAGRRGSAMAPFERAMAVSYRLSTVTVALYVTIRPQFAIEFLRRSNQQGVGHFGPKFPDVPLGPLMFGSAESGQPRLTNGEIYGRIPTYVITIHQRHRRTERRTDDMRSQDRALHYSASRGKNDVILLRDRQYITQYVTCTSRASAVREQESLANAKVSAQQQCVYEGH